MVPKLPAQVAGRHPTRRSTGWPVHSSTSPLGKPGKCRAKSCRGFWGLPRSSSSITIRGSPFSRNVGLASISLSMRIADCRAGRSGQISVTSRPRCASRPLTGVTIREDQGAQDLRKRFDWPNWSRSSERNPTFHRWSGSGNQGCSSKVGWLSDRQMSARGNAQTGAISKSPTAVPSRL